jgi:hypothetical protein
VKQAARRAGSGSETQRFDLVSVYEQIGYSIADVKVVFGVHIWAIASEKSAVEKERQAAGSLSVFDPECSVCLGATACVCACTSRQRRLEPVSVRIHRRRLDAKV